MDAEERRIQRVLKGIDPEDDWEAMNRWRIHLRKVLNFPFQAKGAESQEGGSLRTGDKIVVTRILDVDDKYGVIADVQDKREGFSFPLCDLEAIPKTSRNYRRLKDYVIWFANR